MLNGKLVLARVPAVYVWAHRASIWGRFIARKPSEPDFAAFSLFPDRNGLFLDVGANMGQSALSFRRHHGASAILSIEANPHMEKELRLVKRFLRDFDYRICAASDAAGPVTLQVPRFGRLALTGEASIVCSKSRETYWELEQNVGSATARSVAVSVEVQAIRLDDLGLAPDFVKIDVEGAEQQVLNGLIETLETHKPVLLLERAGLPEVPESLSRLGYRPFVYDRARSRLLPDAGQGSQNVFYLAECDAAAIAH